jgi:hypothetical protein
MEPRAWVSLDAYAVEVGVNGRGRAVEQLLERQADDG